jgi:hypothetical protein
MQALMEIVRLIPIPEADYLPPMVLMNGTASRMPVQTQVMTAAVEAAVEVETARTTASLKAALFRQVCRQVMADKLTTCLQELIKQENIFASTPGSTLLPATSSLGKARSISMISSIVRAASGHEQRN